MPSIPAPRRGGRDLLRLPVLGTILRWRHLRSGLQTVMLATAVLVIYDGLTGSPVAPRNLAGVAPWVQWRGFTILSLLVAGSLFCMACPFVLVRRIAKRFRPANRAWPARLQGKWMAAGLLLAFFWFYEAMDPWATPWRTAVLAAAYFAGAFVVDGLFRGAAFCKYLCPIGQFNFLNSVCSPLEVRTRSDQVCGTCTTKDCIAGRRGTGVGIRESGVGDSSHPNLLPDEAGAARDLPKGEGRLSPQSSVPSPEVSTQHSALSTRPGCELFLFQQKKVGNLDCTFCLDCVHACPHDNVGLMVRTPVKELWDPRFRSSIGRLWERADLAFLALVLVFGAFLNAFGMVGPFRGLARWIMAAAGTDSESLVLALVFGVGLSLLPATLVGAAAWLSRMLARSSEPIRSVAIGFSYSLLPLGFGMWAAHYGFHFLTGALTLIPVTQSFLIDIGFSLLGAPRWDLGPLVPDSWLLPIELALLEGGLVGTLITAYRLSVARFGEGGTAHGAFLPWAVLAIGMFAAGVWLLLQPMEMRGTLGAG